MLSATLSVSAFPEGQDVAIIAGVVMLVLLLVVIIIVNIIVCRYRVLFTDITVYVVL